MPMISPTILNDTLNLIQLARETAKMQGQKAQADRLTPVVDNLRTIVSEVHESKAATPSGLLARDDFKTLLAVANTRTQPIANQQHRSSSPAERTQMVLMMSAGGMSELDIARQLGMTRDEVQMVTSINRNTSGPEVIK